MAEYIFTFKVIASDREGYYYDRWDRATRHEVIGETRKQALSALWSLLGDPPRGRFWKARQVGTATDVRLRISPAEKCRHEGGEADCPATCLAIYGGCFAGPSGNRSTPEGSAR